MSEYYALVKWTRGQKEAFIDSKYSRAHNWEFDGGACIAASSSPHIVPTPYSVEKNVDPEEAFVASISSCHMLFFLALAAKRKYIVESYVDDAVGIMQAGADGKVSMTTVTLRPRVVFSSERSLTMEDIEKLHHMAHEQCFIANSVKTAITLEVQA